MKRTIYLYSGEGTSDPDSQYALIKYSRRWTECASILQDELNLNLEALWTEEIGSHRCPHSPVLTLVAQVCLADLWEQWGYRPDVVLGHSSGELAAAYQAGFYSLQEILLLAHRIGCITAELDGIMAHGRLTDAQMTQLPVHISAINFKEGDEKRVTVCGPKRSMEAFLADHPDFVRMRLPHPWHHPDYARFAEGLEVGPSRPADGAAFVSGLRQRFETRLDTDYWRAWLTGTVDFIGAMEAVRDAYGAEDTFEIIEIGFHPVLDQCCDILQRYTYVASMFRGEAPIPWILHQRRRLDPAPFEAALLRHVAAFNDRLEAHVPLSYQGFTSLTFVAFAEHLAPFFPSLAPQDFYRYKTLRQLVRGFGGGQRADGAVSERGIKNEVVVAGVSCRFPAAAEDPARFWQILMGGEDQVAANPARAAFQAGFLDDRTSRFDFRFFGINEAEAATMDPQQLLALELAELLWRDAGIDPARLDRARVGVYIGVWNQEYVGRPESVYYPTGTNPSIVAGRISYHFDLRGPSWVANTACSSSLVAVHYAAKDIEAGRVDYAIAGGVNMIIGRRFTDSMRRSGFLSKDDRCKTFDDSANGYARAEGGGLVLLARKDLVAQYYAELRGSAVNQNGGRTQVMTAPHPEAQEEVIVAACREAGIEPQDIAYVECHGTGTRIGDPIEVSALQNTVARNRRGPLYLGAVKSNLGHLESAAGIAGMIKALLSLNNGRIPPNLHFGTPNSFIDFDGPGLRVVTEPTPIDQQALVGISSFGFGGTNAHLIIKGADDAVRKPVVPAVIPFDRERAPSLMRFYHEDAPATGARGAPQREDALPEDASSATAVSAAGDTNGDVAGVTREGIAAAVQAMFFKLTGIETIDPDVELIEQGLDSMSVAEMLAEIEARFDVALDPDVVFDYPLVDQFVDKVYEEVRAL